MKSTFSVPPQPQYTFYTTAPDAAVNTMGSVRPSSNLFRHNTTTNSQFGTFQSTNAPIPQQMMLQHPQSAAQPVQQPRKINRNPIHESVLDKLDPAFVKLYNEYIAPGPPPSQDIEVVRSNFSALYSYATAPATGVGGIGETTVPGWDKYPGDISVRVYVPPGEEAGTRKIWPVHFNFHGGGRSKIAIRIGPMI